MKARGGEEQRGEYAHPLAADALADAIDQRDGQHAKRERNESPAERAGASNKIPKV